MPATPTPHEAPPTPAEGEFTLTKPSSGFALSPELTAKLTQAASQGSGTAPAEEAPAPAPAPKPVAPKSSQPPKAAPVPAPAKQEGTTPTPPAPAGPTAAAEAPKEEAPTEQLKGPKQLREAYERAQARLTELESTVGATTKEKLEAVTKLAKAEEALTAAQRRIVEEYEPLRKVHEEQAKRLQEREEQLRIRDYTATSEWHERYVKPITDTHAEAVQFVSELVANVNGQEVQANQEHLNYVLGAPNANEAARRAEQLFGAQPAFVGTLVNYRTKLRGLEGKKQEALKNAQLESAEWQKRQQVAQAQQVEALRAAVKQREAAYLTEVAADDPELTQALEEGRTLADRLVNGAPDMTPEGWADTVARSRANIQGYHVLKKQHARLAAENAELKKQLAAYGTTEPTVETRNGGAAPEPEETSDLQGGTLARLQSALLSKAVKAATR